MQPASLPPLSTSDTAALRLSNAGDRVGMFGSLLCAVHCALLPILIAALPALGLGGMQWVDLDQAFTVFATLLGVTVLGFGYRRHRAFRAWIVMLPGLSLLWFGSFGTMHTHSFGHALVMVAGGLAIATAHLINLRLSHRRASATRDAGIDAA